MFEIEAIQNDHSVSNIEMAIIALMGTVDTIVVVDDQASASALELLKKIKILEKETDNKRLEFVKPIKEAAKKIDDIFMPKIKQLTNIKTVLSAKIGEYETKKIQEQRKIEEAARLAEIEKQAILQKALLEKAVEVGSEALLEDAIEAENKINALNNITDTTSKTIKTGNVTNSVRTQWVFTIETPSAVPREFCSPDADKIKQAVLAGARSIAGINIFEKAIISQR